ncbi:MAB_1171c family putative transporter [Kitasatospora griseola]|uniref:MAB_1171c family putative transporter n=1 Tax=Kitasatospora griseola TaxID=2064 RepID=UPI00341F1F32
MIEKILSTAVPAALIAIAAWRSPAAWRSDRAQRSLCLTIGLLGLALLLGGTLAGGLLHHAVPNVPVLLKHTFGIASAAALIDYLYAVHGHGPRGRLRPSLRLLVTAELALAVLFFTTLPRRAGGHYDDIVKQHLGDARLDLYLSVFYSYLGYSMFIGAAVFWRHLRSVPRGLARSGTALLAVGCSVGALYTAFRIGVLAAAHVAQTNIAVTDTVSYLLMVISILLIVTGLIMAPLRALARYVRHQQAIWHMHPLWADIVDQFPNLSFGGPRRSRLHELVTVGDRSIDVAHMAFVVRDGMLYLKPWGTPETTHTTIGTDVRSEAQWVRTALLRKAAGETGPTTDESAHVERWLRGPSAEIRWAAEVARHYNHKARRV